MIDESVAEMLAGVIQDLEDENKNLKDELAGWKKLFYLLKEDYALQENFQTNEWMIQARNMGIDI